MDESVSEEVESAVVKLQALDSMKQDMLQALRDQGHEVGGGQVFLAHDLGKGIQVNDVGPA
jgi:hypothetical protein